MFTSGFDVSTVEIHLLISRFSYQFRNLRDTKNISVLKCFFLKHKSKRRANKTRLHSSNFKNVMKTNKNSDRSSKAWRVKREKEKEEEFNTTLIFLFPFAFVMFTFFCSPFFICCLVLFVCLSYFFLSLTFVSTHSDE